jgi:hypothetical protein
VEAAVTGAAGIIAATAQTARDVRFCCHIGCCISALLHVLLLILAALVAYCWHLLVHLLLLRGVASIAECAAAALNWGQALHNLLIRQWGERCQMLALRHFHVLMPNIHTICSTGSSCSCIPASIVVTSWLA